MLRSLAHLSIGTLLDEASAFAAREKGVKAGLIWRIAEIDRRRGYRDAGYHSMFDFCVEALKLSRASAYRRLQVARAARKFPRLLECIADGRLDLTSALILRPYLMKENADELIDAASHKTKQDLQVFLAERFGVAEMVAGRVGRAKLRLLAPGYYELRVVVRDKTVNRLRDAQDLMSHANPTRNFDVVMDRLLDLGIPQLEKQKFGTTDRPRASRPNSGEGRYIPADVRRTVYRRDEGRCIFVDARGRRCESRHQLEYDHIVPVAMGGKSTTGNLRLLCRTHNQLAAESTYGLAFMGSKVEAARAERRANAEGRSSTTPGRETSSGASSPGLHGMQTSSGASSVDSGRWSWVPMSEHPLMTSS